MFLSYTKSDRDFSGLGGGTLEGLVQLNATGSRWERETPESIIKWFRFLAHESFHFWNGQMLKTRLDPSEEWLSEGSAEYFALVALKDFGLISEAEFHQKIIEAANKCISGLKAKPLLISHTTGNYRNFYTCGPVLLFLLDQKLAADQVNKANKNRVMHLFSKLFTQAANSDRTYSTFDFLELIQEITKNPVAPELNLVIQFLYQGIRIYF